MVRFRGRGRDAGRRDDRGQVSLLALSAMAVAVAVVLGLARLAVEVVARAEVDAAADAAALAALVAGASAADSVAAANEAVVQAVQVQPGWARVTVLRAGERATSTAALVAEGSGSEHSQWGARSVRAPDPDPGGSVP